MSTAITVVQGLVKIFELREAIRHQRRVNRQTYLQLIEIHVELQLLERNGPLQDNRGVQPHPFPDCFVGDNEELSTEECSFCTKPVHHMCSNAVCESELTLRVCSASCANALGLVKHPLTSATTSKPRSSSAKEVEAVLKPVAKTHTKKAITKRKANGSNTDSSDDAPVKNRVCKPKKFFFTPAADLALLR
ncbi:hypothetical protein PHPALM_32083 [Phytophthora palmivora]|uniref:Uncharacterized protein n=1 Tax=Phytophthora palmivora TaxID=4796 RepID=A0A2P4X102_9STRA|nr:hypothetical protein PHPALM_32083 [Phytophthora palmivora]